MRSLIRKEAYELGVLFGALLLILSVAWILIARLEAVLLAPREGPVTAVLFTAALAGVFIAGVQFLGERTRGSLGYVVHRGPGHAGCFRAKAFVGTIATLALAILPPVAFALWHAFVRGEAPVIQWARLLELAALSTLGASTYALAALALQLRRRLFVDLGIALMGAVGLHGLSIVNLSLAGSSSVALARIALFHLVTALACLWLASRAFRDSMDPELSLMIPVHPSILALLTIFILPVMPAFVGGVESLVGRSFQQGPDLLVIEKRTREVFPVRPTDPRRSSWKRVDGDRLVIDDRLKDFDGSFTEEGILARIASRVPMNETSAQAALALILDPRALKSRWSALAPWFTWPGLTCRLGDFHTECWLDSECGCVRVFGIRQDFESGRATVLDDRRAPAELPFAMKLVKPGGQGNFSKTTAVVESLYPATMDEKRLPANVHVWGGAGTLVRDVEATTVLLADSENGTLTGLDRTNFSQPVARVDFPNGDRLVGTESLVRRSGLEFGWDDPYPPSLVRGEHGLYEWRKDSLAPYDPTKNDQVVTTEEAKALVQHWVVNLSSDPIETHLEVRDPKTGKSLLVLERGPRGAGDRTRVAALHVVALLRSPIGMVLSYFRDTNGARPALTSADPFFEPLLMNRSRVGLLFTALLGTALQVASMVRRLRLRRAAAGVVVLAALMISMGGFTAWILVRLLEPRRYKNAQLVPLGTDEPKLLIQSA